METKNDLQKTAGLFLKFLRDELSDGEKKNFEAWLAADPKHQELLDSFKDTASVQQEINYFNATDTDQAWSNVAQKTGHSRAKHSARGSLLRYTAAAVLLLVMGMGLYSVMQKPKNLDILAGSQRAVFQLASGASFDLNDSSAQLEQKNGLTLHTEKGTLVFNRGKGHNGNGYNSLKTPRAGEYRMLLPDGTKIWLNASSSIRFREDFNVRDRSVELSGEAYFEVAHNKDLPFRVRFNQTEVEVLGTHFNINSYQKYSTTTLIEGAVKVTEGLKQRMIKPGEQAFAYEGRLMVRPSDTYKSIAWKEGLFYFKDDKIKDILDQISRWYDVDIVYRGTPEWNKYSGTIRRQASLNQVLEMLKAVSNISYTLQDRTVIVDFNK